MLEQNKISFKFKPYWIYSAGFFLVLLQLVNFIPPWFIPTDWGKAIMARTILSVLLFVFLWQIFFNKIDFSELKNKVKSVKIPFILLLSLLGIYLLSALFSLDTSFSLWGNPFRNGGFVNFAFCISFAVLLFFIVKKNDWQKLLDFSFILAIIVSLIAIFQQLAIFSQLFIPFQNRPMSVMGNSLFLSIYLLLMTFPALSFGIKDRKLYKKIFYFFCVILFLFVSIVLAQTRGTILGLFVGFIWFFFLYPQTTKKLRIKLALLLLILICSSYGLKIYLDSHLYVYNKLPTVFSQSLDRTLSIFDGQKSAESRFSVWRVASKALLDRPVFGYGPENFMIAFDKYYDPTLPKIGKNEDSFSEWFDRAHNFIIEISITIGIPALIIYILFFAALIWQLEKSKKKKPENALIANGLQAALIGYLISLLFSFDTFSTLLTAFFLIGYSLYIIGEEFPNLALKTENFPEIIHILRYPVMIVSFIVLAWFIIVCNYKPLMTNTYINLALSFSEEKEYCNLAFKTINSAYPSFKGSIIENYFQQKTTAVLYNCADASKVKQKPEDIINQAYLVMKDASEKHPNYFVNWFIQAQYINMIMEEKNRKLMENSLPPNQEIKDLKIQADYAFNRALELSPKRQMVLKTWAKTDIVMEQYNAAEEKLQKCINLNLKYPSCYWMMALVKGYEQNETEFKKYFDMAKEDQGIDLNAPENLEQLANVYIKTSNYKKLTEVYPQLIAVETDPVAKAQLYASLAASYKELDDIVKARQAVLKIKDIIPSIPLDLRAGVAKDVENFLKILQ